MGDAGAMNRLMCVFYFLLLGDFLFSAARRIRKTCMDSEMEIFSRHGVKIEPYDRSHVEMNLLEPAIKHKNKFHIQMEFKTRNPNGVLFYGRSRRQAGEFIAITLQGGDLIYKVQCPTLHADILIPTYNMTRLNDGKWHTVSYSAKYRTYAQYGVIQLDGFSNSKRYEITCKRMTSIVVGGHSPKDEPYVRDLQYIPGHFDGCIRNLKIPTALRSPPKYYAVSVCE